MFTSFSSTSIEKIVNEFYDWNSKNSSKLNIQKTKNNINYNLTYLPYEFAVVDEIKELKKIDKNKLTDIIENYKKVEEYRMKISIDGVKDFLMSQSSSKQEYNDKLYYIISNLTNDFVMVNDSDTIRPLKCNFENNYGIASFITYHLVFPRKLDLKDIKQKKIIYYDYVFTNDSIEYNVNQLLSLSLPKLK